MPHLSTERSKEESKEDLCSQAGHILSSVFQDVAHTKDGAEGVGFGVVFTLLYLLRRHGGWKVSSGGEITNLVTRQQSRIESAASVCDLPGDVKEREADAVLDEDSKVFGVQHGFTAGAGAQKGGLRTERSVMFDYRHLGDMSHISMVSFSTGHHPSTSH